HLVGGDSGDTLANVLAASRLDHQYQVAFGIPPDRSEKSRKLRFEEAPIKGELPALESLGLRDRRGRLLRLRMREFQGGRMLGSLGLHWVDFGACFGGRLRPRLPSRLSRFDPRRNGQKYNRTNYRDKGGNSADQRNGLRSEERDFIGRVEVS